MVPMLFFAASPPVPRQSRVAHTKCARVCMKTGAAKKKGFGPPEETRPKSEGQIRRDAAGKRYDEMVAKGMPQYSVWMRLKAGGLGLLVPAFRCGTRALVGVSFVFCFPLLIRVALCCSASCLYASYCVCA